MEVADSEVLSVYDTLRVAADKYGEKTAYIHYKESDGDPDFLSYQQVYEKVNRSINFFQQGLAIKPDDIVAYILPEMLEGSIINIAAQAVGVSLPISTFSESEFGVGLLKRITPKVLFVCSGAIDKGSWSYYQSIKQYVSDSTQVICLDTDISDSNNEITPSYFSEINKYPSSEASSPLPESVDRIVLYLMSGGTTSLPKVIALTVKESYFMAIRAGKGLFEEMRCVEGSVYFSNIIINIYSLMSGASFLVLDKWGSDISSLVDKLYRHKVTHMLINPRLIPLLKTPDFIEKCAKQLEAVATTSDRLTVTHFDDLKSMGVKRVIDIFGTMETGIISWVEINDRNAVGSIGEPRSLINGKIFDRQEAGELKEVEEGVAGEFALQGPITYARYLFADDDEEVSAGEWYFTGDVACRDASGNYRMLGREKDIRVNGIRFFDIQSVEELLAARESISEAVLIPSHSCNGSSVIAIFVCPAPGAFVDEGEVYTLCRKQLAYFSSHFKLHYFPMSEFPRIARGKLDKRALQRIALKKVLQEELNSAIPNYDFCINIFPDAKSVHRLEVARERGELIGDRLRARVNGLLESLAYPYQFE